MFPSQLLNVGVIVDVIFAVAEIAVAFGAVSEFQLRVGHICPAADDASVLVVRFLWRFFLYFCRAGCSTAVDISSPGKEIADIEENKVICQCNQGEQIVREAENRVGCIENVDRNEDQIDDTHDPGLNGNDKQKQELAVGIEGRKGQQKAQMQVITHTGVDLHDTDILVCRYRLGQEDHGKNIHQDHAGKIENIKPKRADLPLHKAAQGIEKVQKDRRKDTAARGIGKHKSNKPPNLSLQDLLLVKAQGIIKNSTAVNQTHQVYDGTSDGDKKHQIGNAPIAVLIAKLIEL